MAHPRDESPSTRSRVALAAFTSYSAAVRSVVAERELAFARFTSNSDDITRIEALGDDLSGLLCQGFILAGVLFCHVCRYGT